MPSIEDLIIDSDDVTDTFNDTDWEPDNATDEIDFNLDNQQVIGDSELFIHFANSLHVYSLRSLPLNSLRNF